MKMFAALFTVFLFLNSASAIAQESFVSTQNTLQETLELELPEPKISEQAERLTIEVGKHSFVIETPLVDDSNHAAFEAMSQEDQEAFKNKRRSFLSKAARALNMLKYGFGLGSIVKDKISYRIEKFKDFVIFKSFNF